MGLAQGGGCCTFNLIGEQRSGSTGPESHHVAQNSQKLRADAPQLAALS